MPFNRTHQLFRQQVCLPACFCLRGESRDHCGTDIKLFYSFFVLSAILQGPKISREILWAKKWSWEHPKWILILYPKMICKLGCEEAGIKKQLPYNVIHTSSLVKTTKDNTVGNDFFFSSFKCVTYS